MSDQLTADIFQCVRNLIGGRGIGIIDPVDMTVYKSRQGITVGKIDHFQAVFHHGKSGGTADADDASLFAEDPAGRDLFQR